jgi:hypothetical protein
LTRNLKDYALIAEIIGATAVVVSLIYVGISVNQNTDAVMVSNHQALIAMDHNTNGWIRDSDFAAVVEGAMNGTADLTPGQAQQFQHYLADKFNAWEFAFLTHESGMMEDNIWQGWDGHYRTLLKQPGGRQFWGDGRDGFSPAFRAYLDAILTGS